MIIRKKWDEFGLFQWYIPSDYLVHFANWKPSAHLVRWFTIPNWCLNGRKHLIKCWNSSRPCLITRRYTYTLHYALSWYVIVPWSLHMSHYKLSSSITMEWCLDYVHPMSPNITDLGDPCFNHLTPNVSQWSKHCNFSVWGRSLKYLV
jgi:hypothetical protein